MNILLIDHYGGSESMGMEYRPYYLGREWVAGGHRVTIVAASFSHLRKRQPTVDSDLISTEEEGVRFRWVRTGRYRGNGLGRVGNMLTFVSKLYAFADRIAREERPDVVICSSTYPLDIYPGARIAARCGAQLVFEVHDLWPLTPMLLGGYSAAHPYIRLLQRAEDWAYRRADKVVSILPLASSYMTGRGMAPCKFVHIPNGVRVATLQEGGEGLPLPETVVSRIRQERERGRFLVGYAGGMNDSNAVAMIVEAASLLASEPLTFILVGEGVNTHALAAAAQSRSLTNFHLMGAIPKQSVPKFLAEMDALTMTWWRSPLYRYGVSPNKIFDYMLAARPIVQACDAANDLVTDAGCGITVPSEDTAAYADALLRMCRMPLVERIRMGRSGRHYVLERHDYRILAARFLSALAGALRTAPEPDSVALSNPASAS
ncbi:glycosyltransferase family 4 protein [Methylobacterium nigriterrae]|uniref:glycosyltransferase family 4 protein n=1 Tax=Methylobacterium nigriterrae TaxID=3127512 RepID=UPI003013283D